VLWWRKRRLICVTCERSSTETHPQIGPRQRVTARFRRRLAERVRGGAAGVANSLAGPWFQLTQPNQPARPSATTLGTPVRGRLSSRRRLWRNNASSSAGSLRWCPSSPSGSRMRRPSAAVYRSRSLDLVAMIGTQREGEQGGTPSRQRVRRLTVSAGHPYRDRWLSPATHGPARLTRGLRRRESWR
jgi:hypothetical protein